jgi:hypothetical protein
MATVSLIAAHPDVTLPSPSTLREGSGVRAFVGEAPVQRAHTL